MLLLYNTPERVQRSKTNCTALMSDAFHLLSDVASFIVALAAIYLAEKPPTKSMFLFQPHMQSTLTILTLEHTYGFHRAEVIAALVSVLTIWVLTGFLVLEAIERIRKPQVIDAKLVSFITVFPVNNKQTNVSYAECNKH